ncbi:apolipoprotein N-acyltransferase [Rhodovulum sp. DZ06]|uniref:apolipoprotein N-acyltransferase n=1 Tax=Rhodovulum sp. DZ06 TaxID=3425126 RepID=UPI003D347505
MSFSSLLPALGFTAEGAVPPRRAGLRRAAAAVLLGVLLTAAQPPYGLWPAALLGWGLAALLWAEAAARGPLAAFFAGWALGTGAFLSGLWWIGEAFFVDAARHGWMAPFAIAGLGAGLGLFWGLAFAAAARLARPGAAPAAPSGLPAALLFAGAMAAVEYARTHVLTGFPWGLPAYALSQTPVAQAASFLGPHGLGLALILGPAAAALVRRRPPRLAAAALSLAALAAAWSWGAGREAAAPAPGLEAPVLRLVQPNATQADKWRPELAAMWFDRLLALSAAPEGDSVPDLVIWPETAGPWLLKREPEVRARIAEAAGGAPVLLGVRRVGVDARGTGEWRNAVQALSPAGEIIASYDKHHLVPFGEYVPLGSVMHRIGLGAFVGASFGSGPGPAALDLPGLPRAQPQICYETIFPHEVLRGAARPAWIVQVTNDAWFGASAGPWQHFHQARMRAIEQGLPVVRAANTGISAVIDARGRTLAALPLNEAGALQAALPPADPPTPYARTGDWPAIAAILACLALGAATRFLYRS